MVYFNLRHNNSLNASGIRLSLMQELSHDVVVSRRVNSGVRPIIETPLLKPRNIVDFYSLRGLAFFVLAFPSNESLTSLAISEHY